MYNREADNLRDGWPKSSNKILHNSSLIVLHEIHKSTTDVMI